MKYWIYFLFIVAGVSSCKLSEQNKRFSNSSPQTVDMGEFKGLRIIEFASLNYPQTTSQTQPSQAFTEIDKEYFSDSLIQSLKNSDVRVLPSAQTKIHIDFTQFAMMKDSEETIMAMTASVAVSRNGIITRRTIDIKSKAMFTIGASKNNAVKQFILELGELLREQSLFKR